ncbi:unnamed protein product [Paramecium octaurelia]|uniref:Cyclin N-terminal domain-containing protein n=1 Tax=Paramecium octaurelia TaxID=43137 RepID=A0A8S1VGZ8_PAROT|nr:unnamed protein product [Paramecium octaurelia]
MKKWDDDARMKSYVNKILNVKSTMRNNQKTTSKKRINRDTEYSSNVTNRSDLTGFKDSILFKQLVEYNLQQYTNQLLLRGYKSGLQLLAQQSLESQNKLLQEIKLLPGHKQKFQDLLKQLSDNLDSYNDNNTQLVNHNHFAQNRYTLPGQLNSHGQFEQTKEVYMEILKPINRKASMKHFSPPQELNQIKPRVLPKLEKVSSKGKKERNPQVEDITTKQGNQQLQNIVQLPNTKEMVTKQASKMVKNPLQNQIKKRVTTQKSYQEKPNKFINKLLKINGKNTNEIHLERESIQLLYQSIDNGRLASTLINIDIEEISYCVGITIKKMMGLADLDQIKNISQIQCIDDKNQSQQDNQNIINERDIINDRDDNEYIQDQTFQLQLDDDEQQDMKQEYLELQQEEVIEQNYIESFENTEQQNCNPDLGYLNEQFQEDDENNQLLLQSQFSVDTTLNLQDSQLFNKVFIDISLSNYIPNVDIIQNYCKNIMTTTKMEREVAIISMIYINRLLEHNQGLEINCLNWQKILFTALVMASKIWDDESFENNNFAKVLTQFTTIQINEMEKVFLKLIEYHLYVNSGDYARQYFLLRTYADKKQRSYTVKQLDIATVLRLQRGGQQLITKQQFLNTQNKSF